MADSTIISGVFGSERVPVQNLTEPSAAVGVPAQPDGPRVALTDNVVRDDPGFSAARQGREARAMRPDSSILEGIGAAVNSWDTTRLIRRLARPRFDGEETINPHEYLENVPMVLSEDEREYFLDVGRGVKSADYALEQIKDRRMSAQVAGDHPIAGMATAFVDPLWLVVPPSMKVGKLSPVAGRTVSAVSGAGLAAGVTAAGEGPTADAEIVLSALMNGAAAAALYRPGKGIVQADPEFPAKQLDESIKQATAGADAATKPHFVRTAPEEWVDVAVAATADAPARVDRVKVKDAVGEQVPTELRPGVVNTDPAAVVKAVDTALDQGTRARGIGERLQWNMHKTMSSYGPVGKKVADLIYDNNSDLSLTSMESHRESILDSLRTHQFEYEDAMRSAMAEDGAGLDKMVNPFTSRQAYAVQQRIEREVQRELFRREQFTRQGLPITSDGVPARITQMADALDKMHKRALAEMKAAGVAGAEDLVERPGYMNRKWSSVAIDQTMDRLEAMGLTREGAHARVVDLVALAVRRANGMDQKLARQVAGSVVDRALRKGYFEDSVFNAPAGGGQMKELRDILKGGGMSQPDIERALEVMRVQTDDAGKASFLKHRLDLDYKATMRVGTEEVSIMDLIDTRVTTIVDQYAQRVATNAAMSRKGLRSASDIDALREELLHSVPLEQRAEARDLFDNTMAHLRGDPSGAKINEKFRLVQSYGRAISLAWSGLWQLTEYANAMGEYGLRKSLKYAAQELPGFKQLMRPSKEEARSLNNVLAEHSVNSMRLRPFIAKFEDGYEMDTGSALQLSAQTAGQMVPYANAMKFVHHAQAKAVGNLILDRLDMAAKGNPKARAALQKYGLESPVMDKLAAEIKAHGFNVDAWDDAVWAQARPAFGKMMDATVLKGRLGDVPAFAAFDNVGKFLFTYRTFVLTAHNKVLAGKLERDGAGAVGLVMMYQFPLALAAVQAQAIVKGEGVLDQDKLIKKAMGQMGGLGLFSEPLKWATGESNAVGAPGLIPVDRAVKLFSNTVQGDVNTAGSTLATMLPVISAVPFVNGMAQQIKEK